MTSIRKAWRRVMLIVLMPDSVMGRDSGAQASDFTLMGSPEVSHKHIP